MIHDISMKISEDMAVYPNNVKPKIISIRKIPESSTNLSQIVLGSHTGTHVDSKLHIDNGKPGTESLDINSFYGQCKVFDLVHCDRFITASDLQKFDIQKNDIILLKTKNSSSGYKEFDENFVYLTEDAADYLAEKGIKTLGVDYLSVQKYNSGNQIVHEKIINNMTLFEGLDLSKIKEGKYTFVGLPLKLDLDGAPARTILID